MEKIFLLILIIALMVFCYVRGYYNALRKVNKMIDEVWESITVDAVNVTIVEGDKDEPKS